MPQYPGANTSTSPRPTKADAAMDVNGSRPTRFAKGGAPRKPKVKAPPTGKRT